jgi:hypothetical protein
MTIIITILVLWFLYNLGGNLLKPIAINQLKQLTGARVDIGSVAFQLSGKISLRNISIGPLEKTTPDNAILTAKKLDVYFSPTSFLKFSPKLKRINIENFCLNIQYNGDTKQWNVAALKLPTGAKGEMQPELRFKQGEIKFVQINKGVEVKTTSCNIQGGNARTTSENGVYRFAITENNQDEYQGNRILVKWTRKETQEIEIEGYLPRLNMMLFGSKCNINSFYSKITSDKEKINFERATIAIGPETVIDFNGVIRDFSDPQFAFGVRMKDLNVREEPVDNSFAYGSRIFESFIPLLQVFFDNFSPQGLLDLDVMLTGKAAQISKTHCKGYLGCKDISMRYFDFPYLVEHLAGRIDVTETSMTMKELKASHGKVDITMRGYCDGFGETMDSNVIMSSKNMLLDNDLYAALLEYHKKLWYIFSPSGMVSGDFIYAAKPPNTRIFRLYANLLDVGIMCQYFPYPITGISGKLAVDSGVMELKDVVSKQSGGTIKMQGKITDTYTPNPVYDFKILASNVAIDNKLISAFPPEQKKLFNNFEIHNARGDADIYLHSVAKRQGKADANEMPIDYLAKLDLKSEMIKHPMLEQPLKNIELDANLTPVKLEVKSFKADFNSSPISATGTIWTGSEKEPMGYCMRLKAQDLLLDSNLVKPVLGPNSAKMLEDYQFEGPVNLDVTMGKNSKIKCPEYEISVDCRNDTAYLSNFDLGLENITGKMIIRPENIEVTSLSANIAESNKPNKPPRVTLDGTIKMAGGDIESAELKLKAIDMDFDPRLFAPAGKLENYYTKLKPAGRFDLNFDKVKLYKTEAGDKTLDLSGSALFKGCSIGKTKLISNIYALLNIDTKYDIGKGPRNSKLNLDVRSFSIKDRPVKNLKLTIPFDSNDPKIAVKQFVGEFLGGRIVGNALFDTDSNSNFSNYKVDIMIVQAATEKFVSPKSETAKDTGGTINGEFHIEGDMQQPQIARGILVGQATGIQPLQTGLLVQIRNAILKAINKDMAFDNIKIQAVINGKILQISRLDLYGSTASLRGTGTYEPASDSINLNFVGYGAAGKENPGFFDSMTAGLGAAFLKVQVTGSLEKPEIKVEPLPILKQPFEMLGTKKKKKN